ncbi:MAG: nucleotidyltransferase family protein [Acidilobus sp.]
MPFEGWLVRERGSDVVWMVRGYEHPTDRLIVIPYRGHHWTSRQTLSRLEYLSCVGRTAYTLYRNGAIPLDPSEAFRRTRLPEQIRELTDVMGPEWIGLTGSYALGMQRPGSDVDLLVYSSRPPAIYDALRDLKRSGLVYDCDQGQRFAKEKSSFTRSEFLVLHPLKLLDSCYKGVPYTIRVLRAIDEKPCTSEFRPLGWITALGEIGPMEPYLTPAIYEFRAEGAGSYMLISWRTRYQELPPGKYMVRGLVQRDEINGPLYIVPDLGGYVKPLEVRARQRCDAEERANRG